MSQIAPVVVCLVHSHHAIGAAHTIRGAIWLRNGIVSRRHLYYVIHFEITEDESTDEHSAHHRVGLSEAVHIDFSGNGHGDIVASEVEVPGAIVCEIARQSDRGS